MTEVTQMTQMPSDSCGVGDQQVRDEVLELVKRGDPATRRANRYRYLGD